MKAKPSPCTGELTGLEAIPPSPWVWEQQSIRAVRMGRDRGTAVRASRDSVSDGDVTTHQPKVCRETSVGTLLPACRQQDDKLPALPRMGCQQLLTVSSRF